MSLSLSSPPLEDRQFQKTPPRQKIDGKFWITASVRDSHMLTLYLNTCSILIIEAGSIQILMFLGSFNLTLMYFVHFHYEIFQIFLKFGYYIHTHLFYFIWYSKLWFPFTNIEKRTSPTSLTRLDLMLTWSVVKFADTVWGKYLMVLDI